MSDAIEQRERQLHARAMAAMGDAEKNAEEQAETRPEVIAFTSLIRYGFAVLDVNGTRVLLTQPERVAAMVVP